MEEKRYWRFKTSTEKVKGGHVVVSIDSFELCTLLDIDARSTTAIICNQFNVLEKISPIYLMEYEKEFSGESPHFLFIFAEQFAEIYEQDVVISNELLSEVNEK